MKTLRFLLFPSLLFFLSCIVSGQDYIIYLNQARECFSKGHYPEAAAIYDQWLPEAKDILGVHDTAYQRQFEMAGRCFLLAGQYDKALHAFEALKKIHSSGFQVDRSHLATDLNSLGNCYFSMGKYKAALQFYEQAKTIWLEIPGANPLEYAELLNSQAVLDSELDDYAAALPLLEEAKRILQADFGHEHPNYATTLDNIGIYYLAIGDYTTALQFTEEAKGIRLRTLGAEHPDYAKSVSNLGYLQYLIGNYDAALPLYLEASAIDKEALGNRHPEYALDLGRLGMLYRRMSNHEAALPLLLESSSILREVIGARHPKYASCICNLAGLYRIMGNYDNALTLYLEAINIMEEVLDHDNLEYARTMNNLALLYTMMGNYEAALGSYKNASLIYLNKLGSKHPDYGVSLGNLAFLYMKLDKYEHALPLLEYVTSIYKESPSTQGSEYAMALNNLAIAYYDIGNYEEALRLQEEALKTDKANLGTNHIDYASDLNNVANLYTLFGRYDEALAMETEALAIYKEKLGTNHEYYAISLISNGQLYQLKGNYSAAFPFFEEASAILKDILGTRHVDYAMSLKKLASNYIASGNCQASLPLLEEASGIYKEVLGSMNPEYADCLKNIAGVYVSMKDYITAMPFFVEANAIFSHNIRAYFSFLSEREKKNYLKTVVSYYEEYLSFLLKSNSTSPELFRNGFDNELLLKGVILNSIASMQQSILESGDTTLTREYERMRTLKRQINNLQQKPITERTADLEDLEVKTNKMERDLTMHSTAFSEMHAFYKVKWTDVQNHLKANEAAIEFINFHSFNLNNNNDSTLYCALILRKNDTLPHLVYLCEENMLKKAIPSFGASFKGINDAYQSQDLYNLVWQPLENLLENIATVYFAPSGLLNRVAMAALSCPDYRTLMEKYEMIQLSSTRSLANTKELGLFKNAVVYGGIIYDTDTLTMLEKAEKYQIEEIDASPGNRSVSGNTRSGFKYLPGTKLEAEIIAAKLREKGIITKICSGTDANEESFVSLSGSRAPSLIHLSTHGFYYPDSTLEKATQRRITNTTGNIRFRYSDDPLSRSGLLLAGANLAWKGLTLPSNVEDGILTAKEVSNMNLMNTQLVVLSACQTGQGDVKGSEGVEGLQRGFKMAGVRYIIMSLWEVPDKETTEFMANFYDYWLGGMEIKEAFNDTQALMSNKYRKEPFKWAAFVLVE